MANDKKESLVDKLIATAKATLPSDSGDKTAPAGEDGPPWMHYIAVMTGALAALAGFLAVRSTTLTNDAIYESNQAVLSQAQASDAWAEYQAASIKARIIETQLLTASNLSPDVRDELLKQASELRDRQPPVKQKALDKSTERDEHLKEGQSLLKEKDMLGYAGLAAQLAIALASVAALVRRRTAFVISVVMAAVSVGVTAYVFISHYLTHKLV